MAKSVGSKSATPAQFRYAVSSVRGALLASAALALVAGLTSLPAVAAMPGFSPYYSNPDPYSDPYETPNPIVRPRSTVRPNPQPDLKAAPKPGPKTTLKPEPAKDLGAVPKGPLQIVVSIADQHVTLYSNGVRVTRSPVSTGVPGRPTPTGVFSIIQKDRFHHSNLYSNAPMPFMERITWSGVALHEGPLPGYAASHGCIRLTHDFAAELWHITRLGVRVIVARNDVVPVDFAHPHLFEPKAKLPEPPVSDNDPNKHAEANAPIRVAQAAIASPETTPDRAAAAIVAKPIEGVAGDALRGTVSAAAETTGAVAAPAAADEPLAAKPAIEDPPKPAPDAIDPAKATPLPALPRTRTIELPVKHAGTMAVFISRKERKLFVRQGFEPLFDVAVEIDHPEQPLGTHVFTALGFTDGGAHMRWNVMTVASEPPRQLLSAKIGPKAQPASRAQDVHVPQTAAQALDRIQIPQEALDRIGEILSPGASLVISDQGLGPETGEGTDFIVLTH
ncbi:MAG TPA: L,D-transpeptidase [Xanthobacteraceae bacterium]|nr:L,D-transpeptidase [Xanthobacteraceae bacterium]